LPTLMQNNLALFAEIPHTFQVIAWGVLGVLLLIVFVVLINFFSIWIRALFSGARVTYTELIALRLRNVPVGVVVDTRITAVKSGLPLTIDDLSTHYLAGGNIEMVVLSLIAAKKAGIRLEFDRACAIDLATKGTGKTVLEAVKTSVNPKVIDCPNPASGKVTIDGVAKDGVVEAEAQIPLAMAEAFRSGNLGVMDYFRMKNIQADTGMRESIAGAGGPGGAGGAAGSQTKTPGN